MSDEKVLLRCKRCGDEFESERGHSTGYRCFKCDGVIEQVSKDNDE